MRKPIDRAVMTHGYILASAAGIFLSVLFVMLVEVISGTSWKEFGIENALHIVRGFALGALFGTIVWLPFATPVAMLFALPFTVAFLYAIRVLGIRSLPLLLLGGALTPPTAIWLGYYVMALLADHGVPDTDANPFLALRIVLPTMPAGAIAAYVLYRQSLRQCFEREAGV